MKFQWNIGDNSFIFNDFKSPCLVNLYAEYMQNAGMDETQAGINVARRNINNLKYTDDTTVMAKIKEELMNLLMRVKEESEKADLKLNIQKTKNMASSLITSWQIDGRKVETVTNFLFLHSKITAVTAVMKLKDTSSLEERLGQT